MKSFVFNTQNKESFKLQLEGKEIKSLQHVNNMKLYFDHKLYQTIPEGFLSDYNIISKEDADFLKYSSIFSKKVNLKDLELSDRQSRSAASLVSLSIGDALRSTTQFQDYFKFRKQPFFVQGFKDIEEKLGKEVHERFGQTRVWTDDFSMALAMADSLLLNKFTFQPVHLRYLFTLWLRHGLDNGGRQCSIGLGGNISIAISEFFENNSNIPKKEPK